MWIVLALILYHLFNGDTNMNHETSETQSQNMNQSRIENHSEYVNHHPIEPQCECMNHR